MVHGFTRHARAKMRQLGLATDAINEVLAADDVIERYTDRTGVLLYGWTGTMEIHVVAIHDPSSGVTLVTTVYEVDREMFPDGRTRRRTT